jgi:predicted ATPase/class 3 adenylate cyclase
VAATSPTDAVPAPAHHALVSPNLPSGTVTFLFTDIEGSTKLLQELGAKGYSAALAGHRRILRAAFGAHGGVEVDTQGDAFFYAFPTAPGALRAAAEALEGLNPGPIRVRIGLHTGTPQLDAGGYVGVDVHRAARIAAVGHGGEVLVSAATAALTGTDMLRDLGTHRLKDLSAPERIYQLGEADFPPLRSLHQTNLPIPATPFLGREQELAEVGALLRRGDVRLVTLTGPGGTGKTRLGLQAAGSAADEFEGGVWWVPLAPLRDPQLVLPTAAHVLGAKADLAEHIADKQMLLLFDNFEQVIDAAREVGSLLERCPGLKALVTSREALRLEGEWGYAVDPLREAEAVELFETRALAARRDFAPKDEVREICRRLDNLPLAIELAAARVKVLSAPALLKRLEQRLPVLTGGTRDAPERQRTLRATIAWSYELLSPGEQRLFARLSVFSGGSTLEAAEEVTEADLNNLQSLVDKSLLHYTDERFSMLETIREYAAERLEASDEGEEFQRRHAEHFLAVAEQAEPDLRKTSRKEWFKRLEREYDNLRAALDHFQASGETERALRLAGALSYFWQATGQLVEGRRLLERALAADHRPTLARAKALAKASGLVGTTGDIAAAKSRAEEALALARALGDARTSGSVLAALGYLALEEGDTETARPLVEESLRIFVELGDEHLTIRATRVLALTFERSGDTKGAVALQEDNLRRERALGEGDVEAATLGELAAMYFRYEGRVEDAMAMLEEAYRIDHDNGARIGMMLDLYCFAGALAVAGRAGRAAQLLSSAEVLREEIGSGVPTFVGKMNEEMNEETLATIRAQLHEGAFAEAWEQGRKLTPDEAVALALDSGD